ncbi:MAG: hypothetical protein R3266_14160, partial [Gemmatimonadota bacterium]|nr:hypothetical protein [Gemmatimonadota bacterium]
MLEAAVLLSALAVPAIQAPDPERAARVAAYRYENLLRERSPYRLGGGSRECDEIVGRFCLWFGDAPPAPPEPEHPDVTVARQSAVRAFRTWMSRRPAEPEA